MYVIVCLCAYVHTYMYVLYISRYMYAVCPSLLYVTGGEEICDNEQCLTQKNYSKCICRLNYFSTNGYQEYSTVVLECFAYPSSNL